MRPEKLLTKWQEQSDWAIRVDRRSKKYRMREIPMRWSSRAQKSQMDHMISASVQADVAASFQKAVTDVLIGNAMKAIDEFKMDKFAIAGGVASNGVLREGMREACEKKGVQFYHPSPIFCTDNAAMIGVAAYYDFIHGQRDGLDLNAVPNLKLGER